MTTARILGLWLAAFAVDNLWRLLPFLNIQDQGAVYVIGWGWLASAVLAASGWGLSAAAVLGPVAIVGALGSFADELRAYYAALLVIKAAVLGGAALLALAGVSQRARWAGWAFAWGCAVALVTFVLGHWGPPAVADGVSALAKRYGPWAPTVEELLCILPMVLALLWRFDRR